VQHWIDETDRVLHLDLGGELTAAPVIDWIQALMRDRPELRTWDWIIDARNLPADFGVDHVAHLSVAYRASDAHVDGSGAVVALVTDDRYLHLWAQVMDFQFPGRRHQTVPDMAAARDLVAHARVVREDERKTTNRSAEP